MNITKTLQVCACWDSSGQSRSASPALPEQMRLLNRDTLDQAILVASGTSAKLVGARNETNVWLPGFDRWRVPLDQDGIPVYLPVSSDHQTVRISAIHRSTAARSRYGLGGSACRGTSRTEQMAYGNSVGAGHHRAAAQIPARRPCPLRGSHPLARRRRGHARDLRGLMKSQREEFLRWLETPEGAPLW